MPIAAMNKANLKARLGKWGTSVQAVREEGQAILIEIYLRIAKHGDYSLANVMLELAEGLNRQYLVDHMRKYAGLKIAADFDEAEAKQLREANPGKIILGWSGKDYAKKNLDGAKANKWWSPAKREQKALEFTAEEKLTAFLNALDRAKMAKKKAHDEGNAEAESHVNLEYSDAALLRLVRAIPVDRVLGEIVEEQAAA